MVRLCIDHRERYDINGDDIIPKIVRYVKAKEIPFIDDIKIVQLKVGDYCTNDNLVGIERKYKDFVSSMMSGKLDQQLKELKDNFVHPYLFIEYAGLPELLADNPGTNPESIQGELASILVRHHNVTVIFTGDFIIPFVCKVISKHYDGKNVTKQIEYTPIRHKAKKRDATPKEIKLDIISRIPKLGMKKGNLLLDRFDDSIMKIANASIEELKRTEGIGDKLANSIKETLS
jgi:ERCC4-type nuclease